MMNFVLGKLPKHGLGDEGGTLEAQIVNFVFSDFLVFLGFSYDFLFFSCDFLVF